MRKITFTVLALYILAGNLFAQVSTEQGPEYSAQTVHVTSSPIYALTSGEYNSTIDGIEAAVLIGSGAVLQLNPNDWSTERFSAARMKCCT